MPRRVAFAVVALVGLAAVDASSTSSAACKPGQSKVGNTIVTSYCGPAKATLTYLGRTVTYKGGSCTKVSGFFLHIGRKVAIGPPNPKLRYFAVALYGAKDGTHKQFNVTWVGPPAAGAVSRGTLRLQGGLSRGSFSGQVAIPGDSGKTRGVVSGTFSCR